MKWILQQTSVYDVGTATVTFILGLIASSTYLTQDRPRAAYVAVALGVIGILLSFIKSGLALNEARRKTSTHELEGCLYTLHAALAPPEDCLLRLALHVPVDGDTLEQVTEYVGVDPKLGRVGRRFPANAGIIGRAYREKDVFVASRVEDDYGAYVRELVKDWNYTERLARFLNPGAMAWMAVPFLEDNRVEGILFLDASQRDFFTPERQELILAAQRGIAVFVGKRYT